MLIRRSAKPDGDRAIRISDVYKYADGVEEEVTREVVQILMEPARGREGEYLLQHPQQTLTLVDEVVRYIADNHHKSRSYWGAKFSLEACFVEGDPFEKAEAVMVLAESRTAFNFYAVMRAFYHLLCVPEYQASKYCASIEAARQALSFAYPARFVEMPPTGLPPAEGVPELALRKAMTDLVWPAAERFNSAVDKIVEIVSSRGYRSKVARESAKLKKRGASVTTLIRGLLKHHESLTVVAVRLSIRQRHGLDFLGEKMHKALGRLVGDRRHDALLNESVGHFWVLQERFRASFRQRLPTLQKQNMVGGSIALHYDLVMFFDAKRCAEVDAIAKHIGACWKVITNDAGFSLALNGSNFHPYPPNWLVWHMQDLGRFPSKAEFVGVVRDGSVQARNLLTVAATMVFSAMLRTPSKHSPSLIKGGARRYGKSDLLTGRGFDKAGRGTKLGRSEMKRERQKRPTYAMPPPVFAPGPSMR